MKNLVIILTHYLQHCFQPLWTEYYTLMMMIVVPLVVSLGANRTIFNYVRSVSLRIHPRSESTSASRVNDQQPRLSRRDAYLLRHMIVMLVVFAVGWGPLYLLAAISSEVTINVLVIRFFSLMSVMSVLCDVIDIFLHNHELMQYFQRLIRRYW